MNNKERSQVLKMLYLITQIGFTMVVTIFISMGIAYLIKRIFGKDFMVYRDRCAGGFSLRVYSYTEIPE